MPSVLVIEDDELFRSALADGLAGRGMTPQHLAHLEVFWQRPPGLCRKESLGLGLMLMLVRRLVQHLGGVFRLESQAGIGTKACVSLPVGEV